MSGERHVEMMGGPSWDTKTTCVCGERFTSRAEFWRHQAAAYEATLKRAERAEADADRLADIVQEVFDSEDVYLDSLREALDAHDETVAQR